MSRHRTAATERLRSMITDYYYKTAKKRAKETSKEQDTPQDKERLKITPLIQKKIKTKSSIGKPRRVTEKQFQRSMIGSIKKGSSKTTITTT